MGTAIAVSDEKPHANPGCLLITLSLQPHPRPWPEGSHGFCGPVHLNVYLPLLPTFIGTLALSVLGPVVPVVLVPVGGLLGLQSLLGREVILPGEAVICATQPRDCWCLACPPPWGPGTFPTESYFQLPGNYPVRTVERRGVSKCPGSCGMNSGGREPVPSRGLGRPAHPSLKQSSAPLSYESGADGGRSSGFGSQPCSLQQPRSTPISRCRPSTRPEVASIEPSGPGRAAVSRRAVVQPACPSSARL